MNKYTLKFNGWNLISNLISIVLKRSIDSNAYNFAHCMLVRVVEYIFAAGLRASTPTIYGLSARLRMYLGVFPKVIEAATCKITKYGTVW